MSGKLKRKRPESPTAEVIAQHRATLSLYAIRSAMKTVSDVHDAFSAYVDASERSFAHRMAAQLSAFDKLTDKVEKAALIQKWKDTATIGFGPSKKDCLETIEQHFETFRKTEAEVAASETELLKVAPVDIKDAPSAVLACQLTGIPEKGTEPLVLRMANEVVRARTTAMQADNGYRVVREDAMRFHTELDEKKKLLVATQGELARVKAALANTAQRYNTLATRYHQTVLELSDAKKTVQRLETEDYVSRRSRLGTNDLLMGVDASKLVVRCDNMLADVYIPNSD